MPMNSVIQEKRKELGLTQEQVAEYLNVSIPAVSRWENGATSPDISLLPPLARLLKIDLNTLFCFQEDMTQQEIGYFCREVGEIAKTAGIAAGFQAAKQKLQEYPHSDTLLHCLTVSLDGLVTMSALSEEEARPYNETLAGWYRRLSASSDSKIKNSADFMRASRLIRNGDYEKAQEILDQMPDRGEYCRSTSGSVRAKPKKHGKRCKAHCLLRSIKSRCCSAKWSTRSLQPAAPKPQRTSQAGPLR